MWVSSAAEEPKKTKKVTAGDGLKRGEILLVTDDVVGKEDGS